MTRSTWPWSVWTPPTIGRSGHWALREDRIVVSKDEDLLFLANRPRDQGRLIWVRLGNCRRDALVEAFARSLSAVVAAIAEGQRVVEIA